jgi:hypothetical protein
VWQQVLGVYHSNHWSDGCGSKCGECMLKNLGGHLPMQRPTNDQCPCTWDQLSRATDIPCSWRNMSTVRILISWVLSQLIWVHSAPPMILTTPYAGTIISRLFALHVSVTSDP